MEQIKVSTLATEFAMRNSVVVAELKKIGVWVPSSDTPVDHDIADRIRRRLQVMLDFEQQEEEKAKEKKEKKKAASAKVRKTIRQLGKPPKRAKKAEEKPLETPHAKSLAPRKGQASYRKIELGEEESTRKIEITIDDEPVIDKVEAQLSAELLEKAIQDTARDLGQAKQKQEKPKAEAVPITRRVRRRTEIPARAKPAGTAPPPAQTTPPTGTAVPPPAKGAPQPPAGRASGTVGAAPPEGQEKVAAGQAIPTAGSPAGKVVEPQEVVPKEVTFSEKITAKELSEKIGLKSNEIIKDLIGLGVMATINQPLDQTVVEKICEGRNVIASFVSFEEAAVEEQHLEERPEDLSERAPVVTVMGHVDHGKTSLLDSLRETRVAEGEAGGITQHIGAYEVRIKGKRIVFIDTPGHEAFTRMRARGAQATDIVVLVVAADDGVKPQTVEAIDHARAAGVPIVVAINKIDKPESQSERVKQSLSEHQLVSEEWGGDTVMVEVSAKERTNLDLLLEMLLLSAELLELRANPVRPGTGVVLEAKLDRGRGAVATVLMRNGSLEIGDSFIAGTAYGKVRAMFDDRGDPLTKAGPSTAIEILGLQSLPQAGEAFQVVVDTAKAREIGEFRREQARELELAQSTKVSLEDLYTQMESGEVKELKIVLKADAQGSVEVLEETLHKLSTEKVQVKIMHHAVGAISESDVLLASASNAVVVGFNVRPERNAQAAAEHEGVDMRLHTVIYDVSNEIRQAMTGLLEPTIEERDLGRAEVRDTFRVPKFGIIAGTSVVDGVVRRNAQARLVRDSVVVHEGQIDSLRRFKDDVGEVTVGYECGISLVNFNDIKVGDVIEVYAHEEVAPQLI